MPGSMKRLRMQNASATYRPLPWRTTCAASRCDVAAYSTKPSGCHRAALALCVDRGAPAGLSLSLASLGYISELRGDVTGAGQHHLASLDAACDANDLRAQALALEGLAGVASLLGDDEGIGRYLGAAAVIAGSDRWGAGAGRASGRRAGARTRRRPRGHERGLRRRSHRPEVCDRGRPGHDPHVVATAKSADCKRLFRAFRRTCPHSPSGSRGSVTSRTPTSARPRGHVMLNRIARSSFRHRRLVLASWILALVGAIAVGPALAGSFANSGRLSHTDSQAAYDLLARDFPQRHGRRGPHRLRRHPTRPARDQRVSEAGSARAGSDLGGVANGVVGWAHRDRSDHDGQRRL